MEVCRFCSDRTGTEIGNEKIAVILTRNPDIEKDAVQRRDEDLSFVL